MCQILIFLFHFFILTNIKIIRSVYFFNSWLCLKSFSFTSIDLTFWNARDLQPCVFDIVQFLEETFFSVCNFWVVFVSYHQTFPPLVLCFQYRWPLINRINFFLVESEYSTLHSSKNWKKNNFRNTNFETKNSLKHKNLKRHKFESVFFFNFSVLL